MEHMPSFAELTKVHYTGDRARHYTGDTKVHYTGDRARTKGSESVSVCLGGTNAQGAQNRRAAQSPPRSAVCMAPSGCSC